jgi:5-amino-6-(5-phosphoribosylamino)uracil reductase
VPERFQKFAARKVAEARAARLQHWSTEFERARPGQMAIGSSWSRSLFDGAFFISRPATASLPSTNLVFVQSRDGNTVAKDPSMLGGGETDKHLIYEGLSRVAAHAVMAGAETVRDGRVVFSVWHPDLVALRATLGLPRHPIQIVATLRGLEMDGTLLFNEPEISVVVVTTGSCLASMDRALARRPWITPVVMRDARDLKSAFAAFRELRIERVSCVGGRTLARQLIDARLVQDLYLTTSPREGGAPNTPLFPGAVEGELVVSKHGTAADEGVVFRHLLLNIS